MSLYAANEDPEESALADIVHNAATEFVLGTSGFGQELQLDDVGLLPLVDYTLHEMLVNLGLPTPDVGSGRIAEDAADDLILKIDYQLEQKITEWRDAKNDLQNRRDEPSGQAELRIIQDYFIDAQSAISRIKANPGGTVDAMKRACIRTVADTLLDIHMLKEGLREGESSIASGTLSVLSDMFS